MSLSSLLYLSAGTMPSPVANEIQTVKMAQALTTQVDHFELILSGNLRSLLGLEPDFNQRFQDWYGITTPFKITRIPALTWRTPFPFPPGAYSPRKYLRWAVGYCRRQNPTVVYTRTPYLVKPLLAAGLSVVLEFHEPLTPQAATWFQQRQFLGIVTLAPELRSQYQTLGLEPDRVYIAPSGVDLEPFQNPISLLEARQRLSLPPHQPIALYAGSLYDHKGIPTILAAAAQLPDCQFILVGGQGNEVERVRSQARQQGLTNLHLIGYQTQGKIPLYLWAADLLLLPTSSQWFLASTTSPLKLFEYMAAQRPIIASDLPNIATVLRDGENGCLIPPDNPTALAAAIEKILVNPDHGQAMAIQAAEDVQNYRWQRRAEGILAFIEGQLTL
ncbi:glycosyltransferase family 4 protein [Spirulina sp. CCNP1310]|uniref:glycosyltransferase family 4 protein n=1 Tax=Spirulina sp. CCNP1310 TaxID=3110249 RepID=UPI002B207382|nr:glycosyltransferase family 4 protein [Spirulina sp. CCNP1310]